MNTLQFVISKLVCYDVVNDLVCRWIICLYLTTFGHMLIQMR